MSKVTLANISAEEAGRAWEEALKPLKEKLLNMGFHSLVTYQDFKHLEGKMLTIIDASFADQTQRKAVKDLIRRSIWFDWKPNLEQLGNESTEGMPIEGVEDIK